MKVLFLGSGTSTGVPSIGCKCPVCTSTDPRNKRLRASVLVTEKDRNILIDTATDLRQQALLHDISKIDAVIYTHDHADHIHGIDELRSFNFIQWKTIPIFGSPKVVERIRSSFGYIFLGPVEGGGKPMIDLVEINGPFEAAGVKVVPLPVLHGSQTIFGYRIDGFAYISDVSDVPPETKELMLDVDVLVIDALRFKDHPTHMSIDKAIRTSKDVRAKRTFLTHMSHQIEHETIDRSLPDGVRLAYDGLEINL